MIVVLHVGNVKIEGNGRSVEAHHQFTADEAAALTRWVQAGGSLMGTIGYGDENSEVVNANRLLSPLGMGYSTTKKDTNGFVEQWETHPISENVKKNPHRQRRRARRADGHGWARPRSVR